MEEQYMCLKGSAEMDITPDDIDVCDSATFIWSIIS